MSCFGIHSRTRGIILWGTTFFGEIVHHFGWFFSIGVSVATCCGVWFVENCGFSMLGF